jgi:large subunit ribosomal protein L18
VHITNLHVSAQIINDETHETLASASTVGQKAVKGTMTEKAIWVGEQIAAAAKAKKLKTVVFDRGAKQYHGRVKALADAARANGLEF